MDTDMSVKKQNKVKKFIKENNEEQLLFEDNNLWLCRY